MIRGSRSHGTGCSPISDLQQFQKFCELRIEATNHALAGIPKRSHTVPYLLGQLARAHSTDIPMRDIVSLLLKINAGAYVFEAANVRHEHEWTVWRDVKPPEGTMLDSGRGYPLDRLD